MIPEVAKQNLADYIDVFCDKGFFTPIETEKILEGLKREDLFTVSAEHFISDTASYADILLPAAMGAENRDIILDVVKKQQINVLFH